ncbi:MAG: antibiotic biosynthesis monooxygenase [Candidatus Korobacteraceae bacterium]|jgi:heme-degrading monooxygenase HmoA
MHRFLRDAAVISWMGRVDMHVIVWEFKPKADCEVEFERIFGPGGDWVRLFHKSQGFVGTELLRDASRPERYVTVDRWTSQEDFRHFRVQFGEEYESLDRQCQELIGEERRIGSFATC